MVLLAGYLMFLFASCVICGVIYGRTAAVRGTDFVVVLGAGLTGGRHVPPVLASRLDRGRAVFETLAARGAAEPVR